MNFISSDQIILGYGWSEELKFIGPGSGHRFETKKMFWTYMWLGSWSGPNISSREAQFTVQPSAPICHFSAFNGVSVLLLTIAETTNKSFQSSYDPSSGPAGENDTKRKLQDYFPLLSRDSRQ